ncbi:MAG TPA: YfhO family protein, partial [Gemmatimonadales bacterium]|nr:YfhO family protein [Gemmatimonadales bacterium]
QAGGLRLLLVALVGGGVLFLVRAGRLVTAGAAAALVVVTIADHWTVLRHYSAWFPRASEVYALDQLGSTMKQHPMPFREFDPSPREIGVYQGSWLMAERIPTVFGYHGNEIRYFDELWGTKNIWEHQLSPSLWDLYAVDYMTMQVDAEGQIPGYTKVAGPVSFPSFTGRKAPAGFLYRRDTPAQWLRVVGQAMRVAEDQIIPTVTDPAFPTDLVALYPDSSSIEGAVPAGPVTDTTALVARMVQWQEGDMTIAIEGSEAATRYLLVAENWHPGWQATIDGQAVPTYRANHAMLSVALPSGAREVRLHFVTPGYAAGKGITAISTLLALGLVGFGRVRRRGADG